MFLLFNLALVIGGDTPNPLPITNSTLDPLPIRRPVVEVTWPDTNGRMAVWDWPTGGEPKFLRYVTSEVVNRPFPDTTRGIIAPFAVAPSTSFPAVVPSREVTRTLAPRAMYGGTNCTSYG